MKTQEETVSNANRRLDFSDCAGNTCDIEIGGMHPNKGNSLPKNMQYQNYSVIDRHSNEYRPSIKSYEFSINRS